ncbi:hypothetical protein HDE_03714 [Halotydeus destructor]|nr:hypothetical protein HDE_03714 [Halotydeus destructor]
MLVALSVTTFVTAISPKEVLSCRFATITDKARPWDGYDYCGYSPEGPFEQDHGVKYSSSVRSSTFESSAPFFLKVSWFFPRINDTVSIELQDLRSGNTVELFNKVNFGQMAFDKFYIGRTFNLDLKEPTRLIIKGLPSLRLTNVEVH